MLNPTEALRLAASNVKMYEDAILKRKLTKTERIPIIAVLGTLLKKYDTCIVDTALFYQTVFTAINFCFVNHLTPLTIKPVKKSLEYLFEDCQKNHPRIPPKNS